MWVVEALAYAGMGHHHFTCFGHVLDPFGRVKENAPK